MKCPECVKENKKSTLRVGASTSTLLYCEPYYDEDGNYHFHDLNRHTTSYHCSRGHSWVETSSNECPNLNCDWRSR